MARNDILEQKEQILQWIEEKQSKAFICRQLKCKPDTLNSYLTKMGIEYKGNIGRAGHPRTTGNNKYKTAEEYVNSGSIIKSHVLKLKLLRDGVKQHKCEKCGLTEWLGEPIPLELHHVNGDHYDNRIENLRLLCPNCHAKEENNSGKGTQSYKAKLDAAVVE